MEKEAQQLVLLRSPNDELNIAYAISPAARSFLNYKFIFSNLYCFRKAFYT